MCRRNVAWAGEGEILAPIPLLTEEEARKPEVHSSCVIVVDVLCGNGTCFFRDERRWWSAVSSRGENPRLRRTCGSSACLTVNRCSLVVLGSSPASGPHKRMRYVLDEHSVEREPPPLQRQAL